MSRSTSTKRRRWLLAAASIVAIIVGAWAFHVYTWYTVGYPASMKAKQAWILNPTNQPAILQACQLMLANPASYRQKPGDAFPQNLPPALASLGATSISVSPNEVVIMFGRDFGLWAIPAATTAPSTPLPASKQLIPGLWFVKYPGH